MDFIYGLGGVIRSDEKLTVRFHNAAGDLEFTPAAHRVVERVRLDETIFGDAFGALCGDGQHGHAQADHPLAEHGPLPGGAGRHRPRRLSRPRGVLGRPGCRLRHRGGPAGELGCTYVQFDDTSLAYLNDPAQRRS